MNLNMWNSHQFRETAAWANLCRIFWLAVTTMSNNPIVSGSDLYHYTLHYRYTLLTLNTPIHSMLCWNEKMSLVLMCFQSLLMWLETLKSHTACTGGQLGIVNSCIPELCGTLKELIWVRKIRNRMECPTITIGFFYPVQISPGINHG